MVSKITGVPMTRLEKEEVAGDPRPLPPVFPHVQLLDVDVSLPARLSMETPPLSAMMLPKIRVFVVSASTWIPSSPFPKIVLLRISVLVT